jgi:hypothetical protein
MLDELLILIVKSPFSAGEIMCGRSGVIRLMVLWRFAQTKNRFLYTSFKSG